eukprot:5160228-Pyramimonas_sp.AAC.1
MSASSTDSQIFMASAHSSVMSCRRAPRTQLLPSIAASHYRSCRRAHRRTRCRRSSSQQRTGW